MKTFKVKGHQLTISTKSSHFSILHLSQDLQQSKLRLFPPHNVNFSLIMTPPTSCTMLSFDLVATFTYLQSLKNFSAAHSKRGLFIISHRMKWTLENLMHNCVFPDVHRCQFSHTDPNLKYSLRSEILAYLWTYTPAQSRHHKLMAPKSKILHFEKNNWYYKIWQWSLTENCSPNLWRLSSMVLTLLTKMNV